MSEGEGGDWLAELAALSKAATPPPWRAVDIGEEGACVMSEHIAVTDGSKTGEVGQCDAALIAALRNAAPRLLKVARAAEALLNATKPGPCPKCDSPATHYALDACHDIYRGCIDHVSVGGYDGDVEPWPVPGSAERVALAAAVRGDGVLP